MNKKLLLIIAITLVLPSCTIFKKHSKTTTVEKEDINAEPISTKLWGIDISHYQEITDWNKLKEHQPSFIFLKTTEGSTFQDPKYATYYKEIRKINIPVGSYHFFTYTSSGKNQAKNFLSMMSFNKGDLPLVLDIEYAKKMPTQAIIELEVMAFINTVYKETRQYPIIYCDYKYYTANLKKFLPSKCKLWIVDYRNKPNCDWTFWQTTEKYKVAGIKGYVDFDIFNGSNDDLNKLIRSI